MTAPPVLADDGPEWMTIAEVKQLFRVDRKTVVGWLTSGKLNGGKTPGGHWRVQRASVMARLPREGETSW